MSPRNLCPMKIQLFLLLLSALLVSCDSKPPTEKAASSSQAGAPPNGDYLKVEGDSVLIPPFEIALDVDEKAREKLNVDKESILILVYFSGKPMEAAEKKYPEFALEDEIALAESSLEISSRYKAKIDMMQQINSAVFPMLQGGPHNHQIGALAVALKEASTPEFAQYAKNVVDNANALGEGLIKRGYNLVTGGTDNHIVLWDVKSTTGLTGSKVERILELASITANKNSIPGDTSAINPGGVRLGSPALTSRGLDTDDFDVVAEFLHRACELAIKVQNVAMKESTNGKVLLRVFESTLNEDDGFRKEMKELKKEVEEFMFGTATAT